MNLDIYKLEKKFDNFILKVEEFHSTDLEIIGLVGNNGAGKTTFLKLLLDLMLPDSGKVLSNGKSITLSEHWKEYTGSFLDEDFLIQFLTPIEFFRFIGDIYKISEECLKTRLLSFHDFFDFDIYEGKYIRDYSIGSKYKIGIVSTLITNPQIVVFDEPFNFLDPTSQNRLVEILKKYCSNKKVMILISSHDLGHITELCSRIIIIKNGIFVKDIKNEDKDWSYKELKEYFMI
jgi:ABC-2 type transport system ATP-binding protein